MNTNYYPAEKRLIDLVLTIPLLVIAAPLLVIIAIIIKSTTRGPVLFHQPRIGINGRIFTVLKFRTMHVASASGEESADGYLLKSQHDPRVTPIGKILRHSSLDELPQLINVLLGDMSLVGPRPLVAVMIKGNDPRIDRRQAVLPGITGYWQIYARHLNTSIDPMLPYDLRYIEEASLIVDLKVLLRTIPAVLSGNGAW